jgi:hypothetical protein
MATKKSAKKPATKTSKPAAKKTASKPAAKNTPPKAKKKKGEDEEDMEMIRCMTESAMNNATFLELMKDSHREVSCYTTDEKTGLKIRLRPDAMAQNKSTITDIKSCLDSSLKKFKSDVYSYGYSISASYYCDFLNRENYVFGIFTQFGVIAVTR